MQHTHGASNAYFENHGKYDHDWLEVVALREPELRVLRDWITAHPAATQKDVLAAMGAHGWTRRATQHRLSRLAGDGLIQVRAQGRFRLYSAT